MNYLLSILYPRDVWVWHECFIPDHSRGVRNGTTCEACGKTEQLENTAIDDCDAPTLINADTYPMLMNRWEPGQVRGRQ